MFFFFFFLNGESTFHYVDATFAML